MDMTPRERVQTALAHEEPDRVPLDFGTGTDNSPFPGFYQRLAEYYGIRGEMQLLPHSLSPVKVDERILEDLSIDTRQILMRPVTRLRRPSRQPGLFYDEWGVGWKEIDAGNTLYRELAESPLCNATSEDLKTYPWWPNALDPDRYHGLRAEGARLHAETPYALVGAPGFHGVWERAWYLRGLTRALEGLQYEPEFMHALLHRITDAYKTVLGLFLDCVGRHLQIIKLVDDLGAPDGAAITPAVYQRMLKPHHQDLIRFVKQRTPAKVCFYARGNVAPLLPDLIDAGVDILNPDQVSTKTMDTRMLKVQFGDRLSFMGAIDTQHVLPFGDAEDIRREVERRIADLGPGGGFILAPLHNIQSEVPAQNLITMYQHGREVGRYPLLISLQSTPNADL